MGREARELLEALDRVERYIRYLDLRASGHSYVGWGIGVGVGAFLTFLMPGICGFLGLPIGPMIGITWMVIMLLALSFSSKHMARARALLLARHEAEERERILKALRRGGAISALGWVSAMTVFGISFYFFFDKAFLWSIYLVCVGLGNMITYIACLAQKEIRPRVGLAEAKMVAITLTSCSPIPILIGLFLPDWAPFSSAVILVVISYLWAGIRLYRKAEAILLGAEG